MKTFPTTVLMLATMLSMASADVIDLTTTTGRTYKQCRIVKMETDGVSFRHANGAGKVLFKDLTKDLREHFDYDPVRAQAHEDKLKADKAAAQAEMLKRAGEIMKERQEAVNRALETQALTALTRALAQAQGSQGYNGFVTLTGGLPNATIGPVFEGRDYYRNSERGFRSPVLNALGWYGSSLTRCYPNVSGATGYHANGFTPRPFFAVPGLGPNYVPQQAVHCAPVVRGSVVVQPASH